MSASDNGGGPQLPPPSNPLGDQLGLGDMFQPAPAAWRIVHGQVNGIPVVFLLLDTSTGRQCVTLDRPAASRLGRDLLGAGGGIEIASEVPR